MEPPRLELPSDMAVPPPNQRATLQFHRKLAAGNFPGWMMEAWSNLSTHSKAGQAQAMKRVFMEKALSMTAEQWESDSWLAGHKAICRLESAGKERAWLSSTQVKGILTDEELQALMF